LSSKDSTLVVHKRKQASTTPTQQGDASDERAIRALIEQVNLAFNADTAEKGVEILSRVVSDKGYVFFQPNPQKPEVLVGDKKVLLDVLAQSLRQGQKWGTRQVHRIAVVGPIAYEIGETKRPNEDVQARDITWPTIWLNMFAKEDVGWRLVCSTPADNVEKAVRQLDAAKAKPPK
jgi:hypothetical protein